MPVSSIQQTGAILRTTFVMSNTFETSSVRYTLAHLPGLRAHRRVVECRLEPDSGPGGTGDAASKARRDALAGAPAGEDPHVSARSHSESPLDGLITCGACGRPMGLDRGGEDRKPRYVCPSALPGRGRCGAPTLPAAPAEALIIGEVLRAVLTEEMVPVVLAAANGPGGQDATRERGVTRREVEALRDNPEDFVRSVGGAESARDFLSGFITEIQAFAGRAVVLYSMPLPAGSPLAGAISHEVTLPEEGPV